MAIGARLVGRVGQETGGAVVGDGQAIGPVHAVAIGARVRQAGDGALGAEELAGMLRDQVEELAQLGAPGQLQGDAVERGALVLLPPEVGEGGGQSGRRADLLGDVGEGRHRDSRICRGVEHQAHRPRGRHALGEGQVHDRGIHIGFLELRGLRHGGRRVVQDPVGPLHSDAVAQVARPADGERPALRPAHANLAGQRAGVLEHAVEGCLEHGFDLVVPLEGRGHRMRCREVLVGADQPLLGAVENREDPQAEDDGRAAQDERGEDVSRIGRHGRIDHPPAEDLEGPDADDREEDAEPLRAREQADIGLGIHARTLTAGGIDRQGRSALCECAHRSICAPDRRNGAERTGIDQVADAPGGPRAGPAGQRSIGRSRRLPHSDQPPS